MADRWGDSILWHNPSMLSSRHIPAAALVATILAGCSDGGRAGLDGHWVGRLPIGDLDTVTVVLDLGRVDSRLVGQYDVPDYELVDYPVDVSVDSAVVIEFSGVDADFRGRVRRNVLEGTLVQNGRNHPARFVREGDPEFGEEFLELERASVDGIRVLPLSPDASEIRDLFNSDSSRPRLMLLLSPT
jgi:hypothetical protein